MPKLSTRVLDRPPSYLGLLNATVWEGEEDVLVRESRRLNTLANMPEIARLQAAEDEKIWYMYGSLYGRVFRQLDGVDPEEVRTLAEQLANTFDGKWTSECQAAMSQLAIVKEYGLLSLRVVTTAGVNFLVDGFQGLQNIALLRYHGIGTNNTAESTGDVALNTELTTQLTPASTRAAGTQVEGASQNIFRTVGSNVVNTSVTVVEHGIFSQQATGGGSLLDRSVFAGIGLVNGNTLQTTYDFTIAAGG